MDPICTFLPPSLAQPKHVAPRACGGPDPAARGRKGSGTGPCAEGLLVVHRGALPPELALLEKRLSPASQRALAVDTAVPA